MDEQKFSDLIRRYQSGTCTDAEKELVEKWLKDRNESQQSERLSDEESREIQAAMAESIFDRVGRTPTSKQVRLFPILWRTAAVLAIGALIGYSVYQFSTTKDVDTMIAVVDFNPGGSKAFLKLADGSEVSLDSVGSQSIPGQGATAVVNIDGKVQYQQLGKEETILYNTLVTPRGGQYQLELSDGSKVWMNAASMLRYPVTFPGMERVVELTGEAYFEIAKDQGKPFKVRLPGGEEIHVLGTHFNVMAYDNESAVKTTLLEGSVKVSGPGFTAVTLTPSQQAQVSKDGKVLIVGDYDVSEAVAWKSGSFAFNDTDLETIMHQIERWYDVEVVFEDDLRARQFGGFVSRKENASAILNLLELTDIVEFEVEGKKIVVRKPQSRTRTELEP